MKKYILLLASLFVLNIQFLNAQSFQWAKGYGGSSVDLGNAICTDQNGNNFITGSFQSSVAFFDVYTIYCNGASNIFILKTDPYGNIIWVKKAGGSDANYGSEARSIIKNNNNDIFIAGWFPYTGVFDTINIVSHGTQDAFLAKYNDAGHCLWVKNMGGYDMDYSESVCLTYDQNILVCGGFWSPNAYFGSIILHNTEGPMKDKLFLAKYDNNGNCLWAKQSTSGRSHPLKIVANNLQITMVGWFSDSLKINGIKLIGNSNNNQDIFIASFDINGNLKWLKKAGGLGGDVAYSVCIDTLSNCYITGNFQDTATFGTQSIHASATFGDMFIAKYDSSGNFIWVRQLNCSGIAYGSDIITDGNNGLYVTGNFSGTANFGSFSLTSVVATDMFVAHYDNNGNCIGVRNTASATGLGLSMNAGGNCVITGIYQAATNFDSFNLNSFGNTDIFLAKLGSITGIDEPNQNADNKLIIYANPNNGKCNILLPDDIIKEPGATLCVYNCIGRLIQKQSLQISENKINIDLSQHAKGIYIATLSNGRKVYTGRIVFE